MLQYQLEQIGYDATLIRFSDGENAKLLPVIQAVSHQLKYTATISPAIIDVIPSYQSILISYHLLKIDPNYLLITLTQLVEQAFSDINHVQINDNSHINETNIIILPVCYHENLAPDLITLAQHSDLTVDEVIRIHSTTIYNCYAVGFMPGFAYLGDVDARIQMPRQVTPRAKVVKGSVGIADNQTAIYPKTSPGGWQIIGRCPTPLLSDLTLSEDLSKPELTIKKENKKQAANSPTMLTVGCQIKFEPIGLQAFKHLNLGID
ncbi:MAG: inhibitor of KinA [Moritella sp.]|jgi:inhibitor of KinA